MGTKINTTLALLLGNVALARADVYNDLYAQMQRATPHTVALRTADRHAAPRAPVPVPVETAGPSPALARDIFIDVTVESPSRARMETGGGDHSLSPKEQLVVDHILDAAGHFSLPPALIHAVISVESSFEPYARSRAGALGLMQLMPKTAAMLGVNDPFDPSQNVMGGARYLRLLLDQFEGNLPVTLAAYNAGPGAVVRYGGVPPYAETTRYVKRVLNRYREATHLYLDFRKGA